MRLRNRSGVSINTVARGIEKKQKEDRHDKVVSRKAFAAEAHHA